MTKKDNFAFNAQEIEKELNENEGKEKELKKPPRIYAILPIIPLVLILGFSSVLDSILVLMGISSAQEVKAAASTAIKMNVPVSNGDFNFCGYYF